MVKDLHNIIFILTVFCSVSNVLGQSGMVELDFEMNQNIFYQGQAIPVDLVIDNPKLGDFVINVNLWNETNCEFHVYKDGEEVPKLHGRRLIGGLSLARRVEANTNTSIPLFPSLMMDLSDVGDYRLEVRLGKNVYLAPLGYTGSVEAYASTMEGVIGTLSFKVVESDEEDAFRSNARWIEDLKSEDRRARDDALRALAGTRIDGVADVIFYESLSNRDLNNSFYALARMNTEHSINLLGRTVLEGAPWAIEAALHQIGNFYILSLEEVVKSQLVNDDPRIREKAENVLERLEYAKANNIIDRRFNSPRFSGSADIVNSPHEIEVVDNLNRPLENVSSIRDNNVDVEEVETRNWLPIAIFGGLLFILLCFVGISLRRNN